MLYQAELLPARSDTGQIHEGGATGKRANASVHAGRTF
jgi:hypothetical protein